MVDPRLEAMDHKMILGQANNGVAEGGYRTLTVNGEPFPFFTRGPILSMKVGPVSYVTLTICVGEFVDES